MVLSKSTNTDSVERFGTKCSTIVLTVELSGGELGVLRYRYLPADEFDTSWKDYRGTIEDRLRWPGKMHEWLPVSRAPTFKRWGLTAEDIWGNRTPTKSTGGINPD